MDQKRRLDRCTLWLSVVSLLHFADMACAQERPNVMDPVLPTGTIVSIEPNYEVLADVAAHSEGETLIIQGSLPRPDGEFQSGTQSSRLCRVAGANCRKFDIQIPEGYVIHGAIEYSARAHDEKVWIRLEKKRNLGERVVRPEGTFYVPTGAYSGEYEEFEGFAVSPVFATSNCSVSWRQLSTWTVKNWGRSAVDFQIRIHLKQCPSLETQGDVAD